MATAFQPGAFQTNAFQIGPLANTEILRKPINCVLAGQQDYEMHGEHWEARPRNERHKTIASKAAGGRLSSDAPTFTVKTGHKGYD